MIVRLNVSFKEKDLAKSKGAKWNPTMKIWYTDDITKLPELAKWINPYNIICENLYILKMSQICWKCKKSTNVVCLCTDKSYSENDDYRINLNIQVLSYITAMPDSLAEYMKQFSYIPSYSKAINTSYYVNHCEHCKSLQGDNFLHESPEKAFYKKLCYSDAQAISYARIDTKFSIPLQANLPFYDEISNSNELMFAHMETGIENRASLNITQKLINGLFHVSIIEPDIKVNGI